jgi:hypothetical protein
MSSLLPAKTELSLRSGSETPQKLAQRKRRVAKIVKILGNVTTKLKVEEIVIFHDTCYLNEVSPGAFSIRSKRQKAGDESVGGGIAAT